MFETWWNPPVTQAINMPGWFEDHFTNMRRYDRLMAVGVFVGTGVERVGRQGGLTGGAGIDFAPGAGGSPETAGAGLELLGEILFGWRAA